MIKTVNMLFI